MSSASTGIEGCSICLAAAIISNDAARLRLLLSSHSIKYSDTFWIPIMNVLDQGFPQRHLVLGRLAVRSVCALDDLQEHEQPHKLNWVESLLHTIKQTFAQPQKNSCNTSPKVCSCSHRRYNVEPVTDSSKVVQHSEVGLVAGSITKLAIDLATRETLIVLIEHNVIEFAKEIIAYDSVPSQGSGLQYSLDSHKFELVELLLDR